MFPGGNWWEERLPEFGLWLFVFGFGIMVIGTAAHWLYYAQMVRDGALSTNVVTVVLQVITSLANPLMYNGVVLYLVARLMRSWRVSIVGFERGPGALRVKGPDATNTVWIGRKYDSAFEAEAAASTLKTRLEGKEGRQ